MMRNLAMIPTAVVVSEKWKISPNNTKLKLNGTVLEIIRETETTKDSHSVDLSKFDIILKGVDSDGFVILECKQAEKPVFDLSRKRIHGDVKIPSNFYQYLQHITTENTKYLVYANERKHFLLRIETPNDVRTHNLGELGDPNSFLGKFADLFSGIAEYLHRGQIKDMLYKNRMYDAQKMTIGLLILQKEGIIKRKDGLYGHYTLPSDTVVLREYVEHNEKNEDEAITESLESPEES